MTKERKDNVSSINGRSNMRPDKGPEVRFPPPLIFFGLILLGLLGDKYLPLPSFLYCEAIAWLGFAIIGAGTALIIISLGLFKVEGENPEPWTVSKTIIARGPYRHTRNPMYLGMAMIMLGIALWRDSAGVLFLLPAAILIIDRLVIEREEAYLVRKFGKPYSDYQKSVRRWL